MKTLTIELENGQKRKLTFLGWKEDGLAFYAAGRDGQPVMIVPQSVYPDDGDGQPYRFPNTVPSRISPKRFEIAWPTHYRQVLQRWRQAKMVKVDALTMEELFPFDALKSPRPSRSPEEIKRARQDEKARIERHYQTLVETPLTELLNPVPYAGALDNFLHGHWTDELGKDFHAMLDQVSSFERDCPQGQCLGYQEMLFALQSVRFVLQDQGGKSYYLSGVKERIPTDTEAQASALMRQLRERTSGSQVPKQATKQVQERKPRAWFKPNYSVAEIRQRNGKLKSVALGPELQELVKLLIEDGGSLSRTELRAGKSDTYQPEKLLKSQTAKALLKAGLLRRDKSGRKAVCSAVKEVY